MGKLKFLVLHCTATPEGREVTKEDIIKWHTSPVSEGGRGWSRVGYSDLIHLNGIVENLTPYDEDDDVEAWELTNGATGINGIARHTVYAGGVTRDNKFPKDTRTKEQTLSLTNYVRQVISAHPDILIAGHNQFASKACPSFDTVAWLRSLGFVPEKNIYIK